MSLRLLCKQNRRPSNALFYFRQEQKTGIAQTRIIIEKQLDLTVGMVVTVNWDGEKVEAEILALDGKSRLVHSTSNCWIPWVSEAFHARFPVSSLQSDLFSRGFTARLFGLILIIVFLLSQTVSTIH